MATKNSRPMVLYLVGAFSILSILGGLYGINKLNGVYFGMNVGPVSIILSAFFILLDAFILYSLYVPNIKGWYVIVGKFGFFGITGLISFIYSFTQPGNQSAGLVLLSVLFLFCQLWIPYAVYIERQYFTGKK